MWCLSSFYFQSYFPLLPHPIHTNISPHPHSHTSTWISRIQCGTNTVPTLKPQPKNSPNKKQSIFQSPQCSVKIQTPTPTQRKQKFSHHVFLEKKKIHRHLKSNHCKKPVVGRAIELKNNPLAY